jgi:hypothetical protein
MKMKLFRANVNGILGEGEEIICRLYKSYTGVDCFAFFGKNGEPRYGFQSSLSNLRPVQIADEGDVVIKGVSAKALHLWVLCSMRNEIALDHTDKSFQHVKQILAKQLNPFPEKSAFSANLAKDTTTYSEHRYHSMSPTPTPLTEPEEFGAMVEASSDGFARVKWIYREEYKKWVTDIPRGIAFRDWQDLISPTLVKDSE